MKTKLLIEQHFHGAFGIDFNKASVDDILYLSKEILRYGIGGIFPTIVTDSIENTKQAIRNIKEASQKQTSDMAKILGIHLEGIFINPEKKGIHNPKHFLAPTIENYKLIEDDFIKIVTLAPELTEVRKAEGQEGKPFNDSSLDEISKKPQTDNNHPTIQPFNSSTDKDLSPYRPIALSPSDLINYLNSKGIKVQAGHCTGGDLTGCSGVTHLFNAMSGITHRGKSTALSALINDDIYTEIIADGVHVSDDALKLLFKTKPIDKIILISDCLPCTQSNVKEFVFADEYVYYDGVKATSKDGTLAGSTTLLPEIIKRLTRNLEDKRIRGLEDKLFNDSSLNEIPQELQTDKSYTSSPLFIYTYIKQLINNPYRYHNIDLNGSVEWDEDWNIVEINT